MKKASFTFLCRLTAPAVFSLYKGSMLRGTLGRFLQKACCAVRSQSCDTCLLADHCAFPMLFSGRIAQDSEARIHLPAPYCLEPCDTGRSAYESGETFSFHLTLFSYAIDYLPYFVQAFMLAGRHGMGRHDETVRGTFELVDILYEGRSVFHPEEKKVDIPSGEDLPLPLWRPEFDGNGTLAVNLITPCRFKSGNRLSADLPFRQLLILILRRIRALWALDGEQAEYEKFHAMMARADDVETVENGLFWRDWTRYSSRQQASMQLGGIQGSVRYHGCLEAFVPFLALAECAHIGKQTNFGLGQISFEWIADEEDSRIAVRHIAADYY
ncbi:MAG: CRISPR system precrRNA processing endoribonuclease RAMP protein Cas6 [Desulfovibrionaceae bacterium]|nr:CRISPR system precrRNA processing endoribonuclease RAMP protein Cas6 [Desulfovibrionaceae bacterium]